MSRPSAAISVEEHRLLMQKLSLQLYWLQGKGLLCSAPSHPNGILFIIQLLEVFLRCTAQGCGPDKLSAEPGGTPPSMKNPLPCNPPDIPIPPAINAAD